MQSTHLRPASCTTGRLRILGSITHPNAVGEILERLAIPTEAPRAARARDPTDFKDAAAN